MSRSLSLAEQHASLLAQYDAAHPSPDRPADRSEVRPAARSGVRAAVRPLDARHLHAVAHGSQDAAPSDAMAVRTDAPIEANPRVRRIPTGSQRINDRRKAERALAAEDLDKAIGEAGVSNAAVGRPLDMSEGAIRALRLFADEKAHADGDVGAMPPKVQVAYYLARLKRALDRQREGQPAKPAAEVVMDAIEIVSLLPRALRDKSAALPLVKRLLSAALDLLDSLEAQ
jgi:hypothetical protein